MHPLHKVHEVNTYGEVVSVCMLYTSVYWMDFD